MLYNSAQLPSVTVWWGLPYGREDTLLGISGHLVALSYGGSGSQNVKTMQFLPFLGQKIWVPDFEILKT